jgi:creatinine amidohydrolase
MVKRTVLAACLLLTAAAPAWSQSASPVRWEELTAADFKDAVARAQGTCLLPFGILEKHGPHLPLGTDLINVRHASLRAAEHEYALVFPDYYFGQIFEAKPQPGTMAYSASLQLALLQETTSEMARNGCTRIIVVNGHGGNNSLLPFFAQSQLDAPRDFVVYVFGLPASRPGGPPRKSPAETDMHGGERETAVTLVTRPDLVHLDRAASQSGADQQRQTLPPTLYTGIWWYARFPHHYAGDGAVATRELGEFTMNGWIADLVQAIRAVKADEASPRLQREFFEQSRRPLDTKQ